MDEAVHQAGGRGELLGAFDTFTFFGFLLAFFGDLSPIIHFLSRRESSHRALRRDGAGVISGNWFTAAITLFIALDGTIYNSPR